MNIKKIIGKCICVGAVIAGVGVLLKELLSDSADIEYSPKWFDSLSDKELDEEREKVRQTFSSAGDDFALAVKSERLLHRFDDEIYKRTHDGSVEYEYPTPREHGWYLSNDD